MITQIIIDLLKDASAVSEYVGENIFPMELPDAPTYPAIVVTKATGNPLYDMNGPAGTEANRVQVEVFTDGGYAECAAIKEAVKLYLSGYRGGASSGDDTCVIQGAFVISDQDLPTDKIERPGPKLRRRMLELSIWSK